MAIYGANTGFFIGSTPAGAASVVGSDVLSSLKGELVTFANYDSMPTVDKVLITQDTTTIQHSKTRGRVALQIKMLLEKILEYLIYLKRNYHIY